jgi:two-component system response regulator PrrA
MELRMTTVLVADDEEDVLDLVEEILTLAGFRVLAARDGVAALDHFQTEDVHLVVTDMRMPRLDGLGVLRAVKASRPWVPVIIITGYSGLPDERLVLAEHGADRLLTKPLTHVSQLVQTVRETLAHAAPGPVRITG